MHPPRRFAPALSALPSWDGISPRWGSRARLTHPFSSAPPLDTSQRDLWWGTAHPAETLGTKCGSRHAQHQHRTIVGDFAADHVLVHAAPDRLQRACRRVAGTLEDRRRDAFRPEQFVVARTGLAD